MKLSISLSSTHLVDNPRDVAGRMVERARVAFQAGLHSLSVGDHHDMRVPYAQNTPMLGRLLAEWPGRPAGCLFLLPLWSPLLVAEQIGTLAAIHDGPFIVQTGIGSGEAQFRAFGTSARLRGSRLEESVGVIKRLLDGEEASSEMFAMGPGRVGLLPPEPVSWWIGAGADVALDRAARLGDCWYAGPGLDAARAAERLAVYGERCQVHSTSPRSALRRDVFVLEDGDRARRRGEEILESGYRGLGPDQVVIGGPEEARMRLAEYQELGFDEVVIRCMSPVQEEALETIELIGALA